MSLFDELVQSARLETRYCSSTTTVHIFYEIGQHADQRRLRREETWVKQKEIGHGAYGSVWLEECSTGLGTKVRAVKSIKKFNPYRPSESSNRDFARELGTVTKFSHPKVCSLFAFYIVVGPNDGLS
jgi:serine/threonine protein kinase